MGIRGGRCVAGARTLVVSAALLALAAPAAQAGTVSRSGQALVYAGAAGELNRLDVEAVSATLLLLTDPGSGVRIDPSSGCTEVDPARPGAGAQCPVDGQTFLAVDLADGADTYTAEDGMPVPEIVAGGDGNDRIGAGDGRSLVDGGAGDDAIDGGPGSDELRGGDGDDLLRGGTGDDGLDGGAGTDRIDARNGGGTDTIDCRAGGDDAIIRGTTDTLIGCGDTAPAARLSVPRGQDTGDLLRGGLRFAVRCAAPCAVFWELVPADGATRRRVHQRDRRFDQKHQDPTVFPDYAPAGSTVYEALAHGRATRKSVGRAKVLRLRLNVRVVGRNSLERKLTRRFTLRAPRA
jgi:hypothetical protein